MKILRTRAASVSRQGLCAALLVAGLTTAAVGASPPHRAVGGGDPSPGSDNPQSRPHGNPNLTLPDLRPKPGASGKPADGQLPPGGENSGIPATALAAYKNAETIAKEKYPNCHIPWQLVAGIGKVESEHGALGGRMNPDGRTEHRILGPRLTGGEFARITDTDGGRWDGDKEYDRAVGPTQFIPSTWQTSGADGNGDGVQDPNNIFDAAAATAGYLCSYNRDLTRASDLDKAILSYNNSREYVKAVLAWARTYEGGSVSVLPDPTAGAPYNPGASPTPSQPGGGSGTGNSGSTGHPGTSKPSESGKPSQSGQRPKPGTPGGSGKPTEPNKPTNPGDSGKPNKPGGGDNGSDTKPKPPAPVTRLDRVGDDKLEATAGETFTQQPRVRALDRDGKPAPDGTVVRFEVIGLETGARFPDDQRTALVRTGKDGTATAPKLLAGDKPGTFTVRAMVEGKDGAKIAPVDYAATVKAAPAPHADTITPVDESPLKAAPNSSFTKKIQLKALAAKQPVAGTVITATVLDADGKTPAKTGPYVKDADGKPRRTFTLAKTDENGLVTLPALYTDGQTGTFILKLTTEDGVTRTLTLTVETPAAPQKPAT
ncbi:lytic murein transglycosylase [Streptomyces cinnamoneus]|uniref:lytic murein transglycosylase n=1 Tax=Streptomyces cinnamoneus TaxID=53446 RepID=UPI001EFEAAD3|nr:lytic murein transglycosylase [Streptomyces cinnamoneus]